MRSKQYRAVSDLKAEIDVGFEIHGILTDWLKSMETEIVHRIQNPEVSPISHVYSTCTMNFV